jgi:hypothetical protein
MGVRTVQRISIWSLHLHNLVSINIEIKPGQFKGISLMDNGFHLLAKGQTL